MNVKDDEVPSECVQCHAPMVWRLGEEPPRCPACARAEESRR